MFAVNYKNFFDGATRQTAKEETGIEASLDMLRDNFSHMRAFRWSFP